MLKTSRTALFASSVLAYLLCGCSATPPPFVESLSRDRVVFFDADAISTKNSNGRITAGRKESDVINVAIKVPRQLGFSPSEGLEEHFGFERYIISDWTLVCEESNESFIVYAKKTEKDQLASIDHVYIFIPFSESAVFAEGQRSMDASGSSGNERSSAIQGNVPCQIHGPSVFGLKNSQYFYLR